MTTLYADNSSTPMDNYWVTFPNLYYHVLPSIIPGDIKHKILELHFRNSVNTIINVWRRNLDTIRYSRHLGWLRTIYEPGFENTNNIPLLKRKETKVSLDLPIIVKKPMFP